MRSERGQGIDDEPERRAACLPECAKGGFFAPRRPNSLVFLVRVESDLVAVHGDSEDFDVLIPKTKEEKEEEAGGGVADGEMGAARFES